LTAADALAARDAFHADWARDALHLAAVQRTGPVGVTMVTADLRQAQAVRSLGWPVLGA
jgi:hypothetical protein